MRDARKGQGISLAALASRTSDRLSKSRISNYEQGLRRMGIEKARTLANTLGTVSATHLLCLDDEGVLTDDEQALIEYFRRMDERGRAAVLAIAEAEGGTGLFRIRVKSSNLSALSRQHGMPRGFGAKGGGRSSISSINWPKRRR